MLVLRVSFTRNNRDKCEGSVCVCLQFNRKASIGNIAKNLASHASGRDELTLTIQNDLHRREFSP